MGHTKAGREAQEREAAGGFAELGPPVPLIALQVVLLEMAVGLGSANPLAALFRNIFLRSTISAGQVGSAPGETHVL